MEDGTGYLNERLINQASIPGLIREELKRIMQTYYGTSRKPNHKIQGRTAILVDDGAATGAPVIAAARSITKQQPSPLVIAVVRRDMIYIRSITKYWYPLLNKTYPVHRKILSSRYTWQRP
jgi:predicted phosphoribosyltransferase